MCWCWTRRPRSAPQDLAALLAIVRAGGARLVMVGDTAQLGAVEAGGMMRLIAGDLGHWELAEVHRFDAEWEALASLQLRQGARAALRAYDARGRIRGGHQAQAEHDAVALYLADYLHGPGLPAAGRHERGSGQAGRHGPRAAGPPRPGPAAAGGTLADGNGAAAGDLVRARQNTPAVDAAGRPLTNRDTLRLEGRDAGGRGPGGHHAPPAARRRLVPGLPGPAGVPDQARPSWPMRATCTWPRAAPWTPRTCTRPRP